MKHSEQKKCAARLMKLASQETDLEVKDALEDVAADCIAGRIKEPPRTKRSCNTFEDACRYIFKSAHLCPDYSIVVKNGAVERVDWSGREFSDKHVVLLEEFIRERGLQPDGLIELRLETTRITAEGLERLRRFLPGTKVTVVLSGDRVPKLDLPQFPTKPQCE